MTSDLVGRLRTRSAIRRQIPSRKSVQEGRADRLADLLEEAANALESYEKTYALHEKPGNGISCDSSYPNVFIMHKDLYYTLLEKAEAYQAAVGNLIKVKGRYHTEQAFSQLKTMHESNST